MATGTIKVGQGYTIDVGLGLMVGLGSGTLAAFLVQKALFNESRIQRQVATTTACAASQHVNN